MSTTLLQLLKVAVAPPAAPVPPPNAVNAPTVSVAVPGQGTPAPRVTASATSGNSPNFAADPLTVAPPTAPGTQVSYKGTRMPAEQAQQLQQQEMLDQAEAQKNAPKEQKPVAADTPVTTQLVSSWSARLKAASGSEFYPTIGGPHGSVRGIPAFDDDTAMQTAYNPFDRDSGWGKTWSGVTKAIKAPLYRKQRAQAFAGELAKRPDLPYNQHLARRVSETASVGSTANPLWALGANLLGSALGSNDIGPAFDQLQQSLK